MARSPPPGRERGAETAFLPAEPRLYQAERRRGSACLLRKQQLVEVDEVDMGPRATVATADLLPHVRTCPQTDARANGARGQGAETPACG